MTLTEMKKKVLALIEELNASSTLLTDDPDIQVKINDVINQVAFEMARFRKIPKYVSFDVTKDEVIDFDRIEQECGYAIYQIALVSGVDYQLRADGTVIKVLSDGTIEIDCYVFPDRITSTTNGSYEFELPPDVLEIMPYGIAGDLLKMDASTEYGAVLSNRFEQMKQVLDSRYSMDSITFEGGVNI